MVKTITLTTPMIASIRSQRKGFLSMPVKGASTLAFIPSKLAAAPKEPYKGTTSEDHRKARRERERYTVGSRHRWEVYSVVDALNEIRQAYSVADNEKGYNLH